MDPRSMITPVYLGSMDYPCGPPLIFEDEFYSRSERVLRTLNGRICVNKLLPGLWAPR